MDREKSEQRKNGQAGGTKDTSGTPHTTAGIFGRFNTLAYRRRAKGEDEPRMMRKGGDEKNGHGRMGGEDKRGSEMLCVL